MVRYCNVYIDSKGRQWVGKLPFRSREAADRVAGINIARKWPPYLRRVYVLRVRFQSYGRSYKVERT